MRESQVFTASEKLDLILSENFTWFKAGKEQVFLLVKDVFSELSESDRNKLLDSIETVDEVDENNAYWIYNWYIWIKRIEPNNKRVNEIINRINSVFKFKPRENPERNQESNRFGWRENKRSISEDEFKQLPISDVINELTDNQDGASRASSRSILLDKFTSCCKNDFEWARSVFSALINFNVDDQDVWNCLFRGIEDAHYSLEEKISFLECITKNSSKIPDIREAADYLYSIIKSDEIKKVFFQYENQLFISSEEIWKHKNSKKINLNRTTDLALNTTVGIILYVWIYMVSYHDSISLPERYKEYFNEALDYHSWERKVAICILAGNIDFFYSRDKEWCEERFVPMLEGKNRNAFKYAWEGKVSFSKRIYSDTTDVFIPIFFNAIKHIELLDRDVKKSFIELLLILMIYAVEKPTLKLIPMFYKSSELEDQVYFIKAIHNKLSSMDDREKSEWWKNWLKRFLENRKKNKPILLTEEENQAIVELIPELMIIFDEAVDVICKGPMPSKLDSIFWYELTQLHVTENNSKSMARLLISTLNATSDNKLLETDWIKNIYNEIDGLTAKELRQLQEALLKNGIEI